MLWTVVKRMVDVRSVPSNILMTIALASYGGLILAAVAEWPLWGLVLAAVLPWGIVFMRETAWLHRQHGMVALFYLLVVSQGGHLIEHLVQYLQVNVFGVAGSGIFSALDVEWVHFGWNTWVLLATIPLVWRFRDNRWLWLAAFAAVWHEAEHAYLIVQYLQSGVPGDPGLLADGGVVGGGLPVSRVNLHFYYNVIETFPLFVAFGVALRSLRNEWLAAAFEGADDATLVDVSGQAEVRRVREGDVIVTEGDASDAFYVISKGSFDVVRAAVGGEEFIAMLGPGDPVGEIGLLEGAPRSATVRALTAGEVVRVDREAFLKVMATSGDAKARMQQLAAARGASAPPS